VVARASPAGHRVLVSRRGWDVRYGRDDQLKEISLVQALAFFDPVNPLLDGALLAAFKTDVAVTLARKFEFLDSRRFAPLIATAARGAGDDDDTTSTAGAASRIGGWNAAGEGEDAGGRQTSRSTTSTTSASTSTRTRSGRWPSSSSSKSTQRKVVIGVVELSIQRDTEVLRQLPVPEAGRGLGAVLTPWADGLDEPGGEMEEWAEKRGAARGYKERPGRWLGGAPADEYAYVSCMCVQDDWRRQGVAGALMEASEKVSTQWGYDCACLHVFQRNAAAVALYRRCGYQIVDDRCSPWDAIVGKQRFLMVKKLR
jgi:ribosomal protein S18 acetylase RimI-like enzyme